MQSPPSASVPSARTMLAAGRMRGLPACGRAAVGRGRWPVPHGEVGEACGDRSTQFVGDYIVRDEQQLEGPVGRPAGQVQGSSRLDDEYLTTELHVNAT